MFEILGRDARIPDAVRSLIARLQAPFAKLVGKDPAFLIRAAHPARKLLELIAEAGMLLELDVENGEVVDWIARIRVEDMIRMQDHEPLAFKLAYERLDELIGRHEEIALQADPEVEALQESELRECAHDAANVALGERLDGRRLPAEVVAFILITWRAVLVADYLHGGIDGQAWKLGVATLDELLLSIEPITGHAVHENRAERARSLASLLELIRDDIEHAQMHPLLTEDFLKTLQSMHLGALQGPGNRVGGPVNIEPLRYPRETGGWPTRTVPPGETLATLALARGSYLDLREDGTAQTWRLCWVTPFRGHCVLKRYGARATRVVPRWVNCAPRSRWARQRLPRDWDSSAARSARRSSA